MTLSSTVATANLQVFVLLPGAAGTGARSFPDIRCPVAFGGSCVIAEARKSSTDPLSQIVVSAFEPLTGHSRQIASVTPVNGRDVTSWDVSPDGHTIAFSEFAWDGGNRITLVTAGTGDTRVVDVKDFKNIADMAWAPDGRSLFATTATLHGGELLRVMLDGRAVLLRRFQSQDLFAPRPSADGRSLLVGVQKNNSNAWSLNADRASQQLTSRPSRLKIVSTVNDAPGRDDVRWVKKSNSARRSTRTGRTCADARLS